MAVTRTINIVVDPPTVSIVGAAALGAPGPPGIVIPTQFGHTYAIAGVLAASDRFPGFAIPIAPNTTVKIARVVYRIRTGGSATFGIYKNGSPVTGLMNLVATTSPNVTAANAPLGDLDFIELIPSGAVSAPTDFSATIILETALT